MYYCPEGYWAGRPVTLRDVLSRDHEVGFRVQLEQADGAVLEESLDALGGTVTVDRAAAVRRRLTLRLSPLTLEVLADRVAGADLGPVAPSNEERGILSDLAPYGNQFRVWRGLRVPGWYDDEDPDGQANGGSMWYFPLGVFRISELETDDDGVPTGQVDAYDLSRTVARNRFTQPWIVAKGQNYGDAITAVVEDRLPGAIVVPHSVDELTPQQMIVDAQADPWKTIQDWAAAIEHECYFDPDGRFVIAPVSGPEDPIDWTYSEGEDSVLLSVKRAVSDDPGYNGVVVTSESATLAAPIRAEAWDDNPSSPTYYKGDYGMVPKFVSSPYVATQKQGNAAARTELERILGVAERVSLAAVPNAAHEAGDVVRIVREASNIDQVSTVESFTIPLEPDGVMQLSVRERRAVEWDSDNPDTADAAEQPA